MESSAAEDATMTVQVWRDFCAQLAEAGETLLRPGAPATAFDRAEGIRYLTRLLRIGLIQNLEAADADFPFFYRPSDEITKYGGDNPDNVYWSAMVKGTNEYRMTGNRGTMHYWSIGSKAFRMDQDGTIVSTGELTGKDVAWNADGSFEIIISARPQPGKNWLPMEPDTNFLLMRQTYRDRATEIPGRYTIERIGGSTAPPALDPATLVAALDRTAKFVAGNSIKFQEFMQPMLQSVNDMPPIDQDYLFRAGTDPTIQYRFGHYRLAPDEAWLIDVTEPACDMWNFSVYNYWFESFDYVHRPVSLNDFSVKRRPDGSMRIVVAATDPGVPNWIDSAHHPEGLALFRWVGATDNPDPVCQVVKIADLTN